VEQDDECYDKQKVSDSIHLSLTSRCTSQLENFKLHQNAAAIAQIPHCQLVSQLAMKKPVFAGVEQVTRTRALCGKFSLSIDRFDNQFSFSSNLRRLRSALNFNPISVHCKSLCCFHVAGSLLTAEIFRCSRRDRRSSSLAAESLFLFHLSQLECLRFI